MHRSVLPDDLIVGPRMASEAGRHDLPTLMALGCIVYFITVMGHELLGHGVVMALSGIRSFVLTSTSIDGTDPSEFADYASATGRAIVMAGSAFNILLAALVYAVLSSRRNWAGALVLQLGLRLLVTVNLSLGLVYLLFSAIFGVGDWAVAIDGLSHQGLLRSVEILIGLAGLYLSARIMGGWLRYYSGKPAMLVWAPYLASVVAFCAIGSRVPDPYIILISVFPAPILGQSALILAPFFTRRRATGSGPCGLIRIERNWRAIGLAVSCLIVTWLVAPGVTFRL